MAGGAGTRFWPWSRIDRPKQLLSLAGDESMLAETVERLRGFVPIENVLVVTSMRLRRAVKRALPDLPSSGLLCEPVGRNTAPCVGWAALEAINREPDAVMAVLPADHIVRPIAAFRRAFANALAIADRTRRLVTFGIAPDQPETGYGYIRAGGSLNGAGGALRVEAFHEKPTLERARRFLASDSYYWNSGMFAWRADVILEEVRRHAPRLGASLDRLESARRRGRIAQRAIDQIYPRMESISVDHAVMEKSDRVAMLPAPFRWNDIGSWDAVAGLWPSDESGNSSRDPVVAVASRNNVVASGGKLVALLGVDDLAIIDSGDAILVCKRDRAQQVRDVVSALSEAGLTRLR